MTGKYCHRCGKVHNCPPVDVEKIVSEHADTIAREIDREVMRILSNKEIKYAGDTIPKPVQKQ
jgi:hypothetical protein